MTVDIVRNFPFFSIFLAMFAGIITPPIRRKEIAWWISVIVSAIVLVFSATLLIRLSTHQDSYTFMMGHFPAPWGNEIKAGPLEALMATLFSTVMLLSLLGGQSATFSDILPEKQSYYFTMLNMLFGAMIALIYTNDIFTAYVFIEISTIAASSTIMAKDTPKSLAATMRYLIMMLLGSGLFLIGVIILYAITGHLLMENIAESLQNILASGPYAEPLRVVVSLIIVGISIKSALFPFHTMLPGAHGVATTTSSALLSGLVIKSFVILLVKLFYRVFTVELLSSLGIMHILFAFGIAGMIACSVFALRERDIKRMIAYSTSAQVGYIFVGLSLALTGGGAIACYHIVAHALMKSMMFICAGGLIDASGHETALQSLRGSAHRNRLAGIGFTVGALAMIGLPLFSGFPTKIYLITAAAGNPVSLTIVIAALLISMVLNAMYFVPVVISIWTKNADQSEPIAPLSPSFRISVVGLIALNLLLGIGFMPVMEIIRMGISLL